MLALLLALLPYASTVRAQDAPPVVLPLWPEGVPGARVPGGAEVVENGRVSNVHVPTLTAYPAASGRSTGTAAIICPGGAYRRLAMDTEGQQVAGWLNSVGISAFVLKYRLSEYGHPAPMRDVLRAVRLVRSNAAQWRIARDRIGVIGFSAGGHLAATAATLFDAPDGRTGAVLDRVSARPDFAVLVYPVILLKGPYASATSRQHLLGPAPPPGSLEKLSLDVQVTPRTPPTFLVHGGTDQSVPPENSVLFYLALRRSGVPAELHLYERGPHGFGLGTESGPVAAWTRRCAEWLALRGLTAGLPSLTP